MRHGGRLGELPPARRGVAIVLMVASLAVVAVAERDIKNRPDSEVRGNRLIWRLISLNALGALAYLRWGRAPVAR
jgi:hypothetical protein